MPRKYSKEDMDKAVKEVEKGVSVNKASKLFNIPRQTLHDKIKGKYHSSHAGAPPILTSEEEGMVIKWILHMADMGFPVTKDVLIKSVAKLVEELKRANKFKEGCPGRRWYDGFLRRNPEISQRIAQTLGSARVNATEEKVRCWFKRVSQYFEVNGFTDILEDPSRMFNADETAFFLCPKGQPVLVRKGAKTVYNRAGNDEKECLTVLVGSSANGTLMPVLALYPYKRMPTTILGKFPKKWSIGRTESGWMTCESFFEYMANVFNPFLAENKIKKPVVLFLDGHVSHLSFHLCQFCKENGIILVALLPHATHFLQPMDVAVFRSLKNVWVKLVTTWRLDNNGARLKREDFAPIVETAIKTTLNKEMIANGFRKCGLYPFNENAINYNSFLKSSSEPRACISSIPPPRKSDKNDFLEIFEKHLGSEKLSTFIKCSKEWNGEIKDESLFYFWRKIKAESSKYLSDQTLCADMSLGDSTFQANQTLMSNVTFTWPSDTIVMDIIDDDQTPNAGKTTENVAQKENITVDELFEKILTLDITPKKIDKTNNTPQETKNNCVNTTQEKFPTPFKNALIWPNVPTPSSTLKKQKKKIIPTVAVAEEYIEYQRLLDEEKKKKQEQIESRKKKREGKLSTTLKNFEENDRAKINFVQGDYVVVNYEGQKYPGQVLKRTNCDNNPQFEIKTMTMSNIVNGRMNWRWPQKDDIFNYKHEDVLKKIKPPVKINKRGVFSVEDF